MKRFNSMNEMWHNACQILAMHGSTQASRGGETVDVVGWAGQLANVDRNVLVSEVRRMDPAYACAELLWYLRHDCSVEMLCAYAPSYKRFANPQTVNGRAFGAYGDRWRSNPGFISGKELLLNRTGIDCPTQIDAVIELLKVKPDSRQGVVAMWDSGDILAAIAGEMNDMPCTLSMQFLIRHGKLDCVVNMRSNDVWLGMPYDVFCFTSLQRIVASRLGIKAGTYTHFVGSLHAYKKDIEKHDFVKDMPLTAAKNAMESNCYDEQLGPWGVLSALAVERQCREFKDNLIAFAEVATLCERVPGTVLTDAATICAMKMCPTACDVDSFLWSGALKRAWQLKYGVES